MSTRLVGVDAESFYDTAIKFSLTSMGAEAYIRDRRFHEIGWSAKAKVLGDKRPVPTQWYDARNWKGMHQWLLSLKLDEPGTIVVAHNGAAFDFMILSWIHGIVPWRMVDTLQMSRWRYGKAGPGGQGNGLAALARYHNLPAKGDEIVHANGKTLADFNGVELARYGHYCAHDTDLMLEIFEREASWFKPDDFTAMHLLAHMSAVPRIHLDVPLLQAALVEERANKKNKVDQLAEQIGIEPRLLRSAVMSNPKFALILEELGVEPIPMKISKTTGKPTFAFAKTDPEMQEFLESDDELLAEVTALRVGLRSTIMESRLERFLDVASRGTLPAAMRIHGAHTGRAAADGGIHKCQLHNVPKRANARNALRVGMQAGPGQRWYAADSSQVEVRTLAELAGEDVLLKVFRRGARARDKELEALAAGDLETAKHWHDRVEAADPYLGLGPTLFRRQITRADKFERNVNKAAILAAQFKQGGKGFRSHCKRNGIDIDLPLAEQTIDAYRDRHYHIGVFWKQCREAVRALAGERSAYTFGVHNNLVAEHGWLTLPSGRRLEYRDCTSQLNEDNGFTEYSYTDKFTGARKYLYDGRLCENIVQAVAYDILIWQAVQILKNYGEHLVLFTHDELGYIGDEGDEEYWRDILVCWMRTAPPWLPDVPLDCEFGSGPTYADV